VSGRVFCARIDPAAGGAGLGPVRDRLRTWLQGAGLAEPDLHGVLIAAGEACSNVVEHSGAEPDADRPAAWIRASCDGGWVRVVVTDRGRWKAPVRTTGRGSRGRGRLMMAGLVDHVSILTGPDGTTVELIKEHR
jgi:anti-sigma regulatory factor (Ser/Thr protein kinase)